MNILFVSPPPSLPGRLHRIRTFDIIRILAKHHNIYLLAVTTESGSSQEFREIKAFCKWVKIIRVGFVGSIVNGLLSLDRPFEVGYCKVNNIRYQIEAIIKKYSIDLVYLKRLRSALWITESKVPVILDTTDAMSMYYERALFASPWWQLPFFWHEWITYKRFERQILRRIKHWIVSSPVDASYLNEIAPKDTRIHIVPNPVDTDFFYPRNTGEKSKSLLFRGLMDKLVNVDAVLYFVRMIFPLISQIIPDACLTIVGPQPVPSIRKLHDGKRIVVAGFVRDMAQTLGEHEVIVCPVRVGAGTRHKIIQAWAMGKAVVSTSCGSEGLLVHNRKNILIADSPADFAASAIKLLTNKKLRHNLGLAGRRTAEKFYSSDAVKKKIEQVIEEVTS